MNMQMYCSFLYCAFVPLNQSPYLNMSDINTKSKMGRKMRNRVVKL